MTRCPDPGCYGAIPSAGDHAECSACGWCPTCAAGPDGHWTPLARGFALLLVALIVISVASLAA